MHCPREGARPRLRRQATAALLKNPEIGTSCERFALSERLPHDRGFLDRIASHILAFEGDSRAVFFNGNYQEYEADKKKSLGEEGARPKRIRFKPLKTV